MKSLCVAVLLGTMPAFAATPTSLANKVYRQTTGIASIRKLAESTLVFAADGRFTTLVDAEGTTVQPLAELRKVYLSPAQDGRYVYQRVSDASAHVDLTYDNGATATLDIPADATTATSDTAVQLTDRTSLAPVLNLSLRSRVEPGRSLIAGFVIGGAVIPQTQFVPEVGELRREVLIRVVGPGLTQFGVPNVWADPDFQLYRGTSPAFVNEIHYADWTVVPTFNGGQASPGLEKAFRKIFSAVGAFPLDSGSKDAAAIVRLNAGAYTIVCNAPDGDPGGEVRRAVYLLP